MAPWNGKSSEVFWNPLGRGKGVPNLSDAESRRRILPDLSVESCRAMYGDVFKHSTNPAPPLSADRTELGAAYLNVGCVSKLAESMLADQDAAELGNLRRTRALEFRARVVCTREDNRPAQMQLTALNGRRFSPDDMPGKSRGIPGMKQVLHSVNDWTRNAASERFEGASQSADIVVGR